MPEQTGLNIFKKRDINMICHDYRLYINPYENCYCSARRNYLLYKVTDEIGVIARHFNADVVSKLKTSRFNGSKRLNRIIRNMPQYKFRRILSYKLPLKYGVKVLEKSEAYTSVVGRVLCRLVGLDVHKSSAIAFALKVVDYSRLKLILSEVRSDEADGRVNYPFSL